MSEQGTTKEDKPEGTWTWEYVVFEPGITQWYERKALKNFVAWYRQAQPTITEAAQHAYSIAKTTVGRLTAIEVLRLLYENGDWIDNPPDRYGSSHPGLLQVTISDITTRHLVKHLEQVIQTQGIAAAYQEEQ